jgi:tetratricopeptide (TPR) repeat protein
MDVEWALIAGTVPKSLDDIPAIVKQTLECDFETVFHSERVKDLLSISNTKSQSFDSTAQTTFEEVDRLQILQSACENLEDELSRLSIGISSLHAFIQVNWTGPDLTFTPSEVIYGEAGAPLSSSISGGEQNINSKAIAVLASNGEPAYHLSQCAVFLYLALRIFQLPFRHIETAPWWSLRADRVHKDILDEPTPLPPNYFDELDKLSSIIPNDGDNVDLTGRLKTEKALVHHLLKQDKFAAQEFVESARIIGLQYELTGVKGRRTKFQVDDITQLVLLAKSRHRTELIANSGPHLTASASTTDDTAPSAPETILLNDETLLEKTEYTSTSDSTSSALSKLDPNDQPALHPLDQCILLGLCLNVRNTSPQHGLTAEQMSPYISRVISHPENWSIHTMALLLRARLEANRTRTVERSTLQLQALIDQMPTSDSSVAERLRFFHQLALPSKWDMQRELAMRLVSLGVLKSALEILERLEMWEECVQCWQAMEQPRRGLEIVRDLLEGKKEEADAVLRRAKGGEERERVRGEIDRARESKLWCLLGELESDRAEEHFKKAWEISEHKSGRAARSLGGYYFARGQYPQAIQCLKEAVSIQPLLARSWFILGCAFVREERWSEARDAFGRCVSLDEEDGESWNNLASVYLRLGVHNLDDAGTDDEGDPVCLCHSVLECLLTRFRMASKSPRKANLEPRGTSRTN